MPERLKEGDSAPDFDLLSPPGKKIKLSNLIGERHVVLYFYPKDDTPGCTLEAKQFGDRLAEIRDLGAEVLGVSLDTLESHEAFQKKCGIPFPLLADTNKLVSGNYRALNDKGTMTERITYLIGRDGTIRKVWEEVNPEQHAEEVIAALKALQG